MLKLNGKPPPNLQNTDPNYIQTGPVATRGAQSKEGRRTPATTSWPRARIQPSKERGWAAPRQAHDKRQGTSGQRLRATGARAAESSHARSCKPVCITALGLGVGRVHLRRRSLWHIDIRIRRAARRRCVSFCRCLSLSLFVCWSLCLWYLFLCLCLCLCLCLSVSVFACVFLFVFAFLSLCFCCCFCLCVCLCFIVCLFYEFMKFS